MTKDHVSAQPLLGSTVLDSLRDEFDDEGVWTVFAHNFLTLLPDETERLRATLTTGDLPGARDAALRLRTSCQMVGAERLAGLALDLQWSLRLDARHMEPERILPRLAAAHLPRIQRCGRQTTYLLERYLHPASGKQGS